MVREDGKPVVQTSTDPAPGFYVSATSLQDEAKDRANPLRYVNSETIPYIVVPPLLLGQGRSKVRRILRWYWIRRIKSCCYAIVADLGPSNRIGEGSIALANAIGVPLAGGAHPLNGGGVADGIITRYSPARARDGQKLSTKSTPKRERLPESMGRPTTFIKRSSGSLKPFAA